MQRTWPMLCALAPALLSGAPAAGGEIRIERFSLTPTELAPGGSIDVHVRVRATGVPIVSYVLRTAKPMARAAAPPGFAHYLGARRLAYIAEHGQVHLRDNGQHDLDPADRAFRIRVSTKGWKPGRYPLAIFAHNRPGKGAHIVDWRAFDVIVTEKRVQVVDMSKEGKTRLVRCVLEPPVAAPGEPVLLRLALEGPDAEGVQIRQTYHVARQDTPPGLTYSPELATGILADKGARIVTDNGPLDTDPADGCMAIRLDTRTWRPGLYYFEVTLPTALGRPSTRHLGLKAPGPTDRLDVTVSPSWPMIAGTHAERLTRLANGALLHTEYLSTDGGRTWRRRASGTIGSGAEPLRDGRVLGMGYRTQPIDGREGWYRGQRFESRDGGVTVTGPLDTEFHVPQAKAAHGHAFHPGPLFMRSIVECPDGRLVALTAGWFKGDDTPCPYSPKRPYSRTYTCESTDGGKTWRYLSTIGYAHIGSEGYNEGSMKALPDGRLVAVLRTGSMTDRRCHDNPIMVSTSADGGRTWAEPWRSGVNGAFPDVIVLADGTLAMSYGRPGASIAFSADAGRTWTDHTVVDPTPYSGYTSLREIAPGEILVAFGTKDRIDPATGRRSNGIRLAIVRLRRRQGASPASALERAGDAATDLGDGFYECEYASKALGKRGRFVVHLPAAYDPARSEPYALVVFLHGAGRHCRTLLDRPGARAVLARSPAVVLLPDGANSWWVDSPVVAGSRYASHLAETIGLVTEAMNVSADASRRAIGGWSMGGFGSANYLADHSDAFGCWSGVVALVDFPNPRYDASHNHSVPSVLGPASGWPALNPLGKAARFKGKAVYLVTAEEAFDRLMNEAFSAKLTSLGVAHKLDVLPGGHTIQVIEAALPKIFDFFHQQIARRTEQ